MKYQQLIIGIIIGMALAYGGMRLQHHLQRVGAINSTTFALSQPAQAEPSKKTENELTLSTFSLMAQAKLGQVTFSYDFVPTNESVNAVMQVFINVAGNWQAFTPSDDNGTIVLNLYKNLDAAGSFKIDLPKGTYSAYRLFLFDAPDGHNADFNHVVWDSSKEHHLTLPTLDLTVLSSSAPIDSPTLSYPPNPLEEDEGNGLTTVTLPALVKYPEDYSVQGGGFWAMVKGSGGFSQVWADAKNASEGGSSLAPNLQIPVNFVLKDLKPGIFNVQLGLFTSSFGSPIQWIWPGFDFEVGGDAWEVKAPLRRIPLRLQVVNDRFELLSGKPYDFYSGNPAAVTGAKFVRGGNYGNAITWTLQPALDTPGYFTLLAGTGCHYIRFNFNPDRYLDQRVYQDVVDQAIQNIWSAGLYPIIAPQDLPAGDTLTLRVDKGDKLLSMVAERYAGESVWIEVCNEPHEFGTWADWKPVAARYVKTIRSIDPHAFVVVPFENFSKSGVGAASSPITDVHVDLYDGHAYIEPTQVASAYGAAIKAGLPVMIGEYGANNAQYLHEMDVAFQSLSPLAISPWAFTVSGQDTLPLVADGSTANLVLTSAGQAIADDYSRWDSGRRIQ
jgi:hypothetical protein